MNKKTIVIGIILLVIFGAAAYNMTRKSSVGGGLVPMIDSGQAAKDFTLDDLDGNQVSLSDYKGKVIFLNFWATWCPPCRSEIPSMERLYQNLKDKDFVMLAVDIGESKKKVESFISKGNYTFKVLLDSENKIAKIYKVAGIPTTLILDKEGNIILRETGSRDWSTPDIISKIEELLK